MKKNKSNLCDLTNLCDTDSISRSYDTSSDYPKNLIRCDPYISRSYNTCSTNFMRCDPYITGPRLPFETNGNNGVKQLQRQVNQLRDENFRITNDYILQNEQLQIQNEQLQIQNEQLQIQNDHYADMVQKMMKYLPGDVQFNIFEEDEELTELMKKNLEKLK